MIGAMYENGGNTTHRFLDGHPGLYVYPFESQIGTRHVDDALASMFPKKYRWPEFILDASSHQDYKAIIDEEAKVRARTPHVSKFRHVDFALNDDERCERYQQIVAKTGRSRANNVAAFFRATFDMWTDLRASGDEQVYVGYSPIITVDADRILRDLPQAHVLHVVRNPWSAYADTKKRPVPMGLEAYMQAWNVNQQAALSAARRAPDRVHIVRTEDVMADSRKALAPVLAALGLDDDPALASPSFNGAVLPEVYPWGTIRKATTEANRATAGELDAREVGLIADLAWQYLDIFDYRGLMT
jgi:hypothetical protein